MSTPREPYSGRGDSSHFTYRHLQLLRGFSTRTPLRVIAHIDLDAFYAQCEMVRLNTARDQPLAVQQWDALIAVNYAARPYNITRMISAKEAKRRCPHLSTPHVATFREGEGDKWAYREEGDNCVATDKVCLDPYRAESRKILRVMDSALLAWAEKIDLRHCGEGRTRGQNSADMVRLEKGGIDEVFVDLSSLVYWTLMERFPMLHYADAEEKDIAAKCLPKTPTTALEWGKDDELVDLDTGESEEDDPDWDDIVMLIGAEIVKFVRSAVLEQLKYTCSGGIARNKMMAKLGSACNKPNKQTVVRNRAVQQFLSGFKFTKIRMLGGKLGKQIAATFETEEVGELLHVPLEQLKVKLADDTGTWLYELIRGNEHSEVNPRTEIKSMLSTKSFRPGIGSSDQAEKWLRIFVAEIYGRLVDEGVLENKRRPKVISIHYRHHDLTRSRQIPMPSGKAIDQVFLFDLAKTLLHQTLRDGNIWPCANLSLTVSGFETGPTGNQSLDGFFVRNQITQKRPSTPLINDSNQGGYEDDGLPESKRQKAGEGEATIREHEASEENNQSQGFAIPAEMGSYKCSTCKRTMFEYERVEHEDWHFAKNLETQEQRFRFNSPRGRGNAVKRQSRLAFK